MEIVISDDVFVNTPPHKLLGAIERAIDQNHSVQPENLGGEPFEYWATRCSTDLKQPEIIDLLNLQLTSSILTKSTRSVRVVAVGAEHMKPPRFPEPIRSRD